MISYVGYQTVSRGITSDFSNDNEFNVTHALVKGVYAIKLQEFTDDEIVALPPPAHNTINRRMWIWVFR